jgi:signal transduction histidine kinase/PAS domain-containing protein
MFEFLSNILNPDKYMPHGSCYYWQGSLVWLHVISDSLIGIAYISIPIVIWYFIRQKKNIPFNWMFASFAIFILACGGTHIMEVWNVWHSAYWFSGGIKAVTAVASLFTAVALVYVLPEALKLKTPQELEGLNRILEKEIEARKIVEAKLQKTNEELERRVQERTAQLEKINENLSLEIKQREKFENELKESKERFRLALKNSPIEVFHQDKDLKYTWVYNFSEDLEKDLIINKTDYDIFQKEDADYLRKIKSSVMKTGKGFRDEIEIKSGDTIKYYDFTIEPLKDKFENIAGVGCSAIDITSRVNAEKEQIKLHEITKQHLANLDAVIESIPDAIYIGDETGINKANKIALGLLGFETLEELKIPIEAFSKKLDTRYYKNGERIAPEKEGFNLALKGKHCIREILIRNSRINEDKILRSSSAPIKLDNKIIGALSINTDITKNKVVEKERESLYKLEKKARLEAEQTRTRLTYLAEATKILSSSLDYYQTLSTLAKLLTPRFADWCIINVVKEDGAIKQVTVSHADADKIKWAFELSRKYPLDPNRLTGFYNVIQTGRSEFYPVIPEEMLRSAAKDEKHWEILKQVGYTSAMIIPLKIREKVLGVLTLVSAESKYNYTKLDLNFAEDLASRAAISIENARNYFQIQKLNEKLEDRVRERTAELESFSYSVSHDLRAPLRSIDNFSRMLLENIGTGLDENSMKYISIVRNSAVQMEKLINDLLAFSKLGIQELDTAELNIEEIVNCVIDEQKKYTQNDLNYIQVGTLFPAKGDRSLIIQVFSNLLSNAIKFCRKNSSPKINIGSYKKDKQIVYFVKDNGEGFDMKYADKLFAVFQRLHKVEDFEGTGVGLAIVQRIIRKHGGKVWADGQPKNGATFYFSLPIIPA